MIRLDGLVEENARARTFSQVTTASSDGRHLAVDGVEVRTPDGASLIRALDLRLEPGDTLLVSGPSGIGKTVLHAEPRGTLAVRVGQRSAAGGHDRRRCSCLSCRTSRSATSAPSRRIRNEEGAIDDREIQQALIKVALPHLAIRLNDVGDWGKVLSVGEQQRIAFARILLTKPRAVFLDESTSALDEGLELTLYELIRAELPEMILVSVSHRATVEQFHARQLELVGGGEWRLEPLATRS